MAGAKEVISDIPARRRTFYHFRDGEVDVNKPKYLAGLTLKNFDCEYPRL